MSHLARLNEWIAPQKYQLQEVKWVGEVTLVVIPGVL